MGSYCPNCGKDGIKWTSRKEETPDRKIVDVEYGKCSFCGYEL